MFADDFNKLKEWYKSKCDGIWEHNYGISIETLDNPGWLVKIDIQHLGRHLSNFNRVEGKDDTGWFNIRIEDGVFMGAGDIDKLEFIINTFVNFLESCE
jgi:hypothetical protein